MGNLLKLLKIQSELNAPKSQRNDFGKYNYRSCEDILSAVKPLCVDNNACLVISDEIEQIGERYYVKATATLYDTETGEKIAEVNARARESEEKKGMDSSQVTGATSSYARKYALNGLFAIDDTKDADTNEYTKRTKTADRPQNYNAETGNKAKEIEELLKHSTLDMDDVLEMTKGIPLDKLNERQYNWLIDKINKYIVE